MAQDVEKKLDECLKILRWAKGVDKHHIYLMFRSVVLAKVNYAPFVDMCESSQAEYDNIDRKIVDFI